MSYKEKPQIKLYKYENSAFILQAIIDDYQECSFEANRFEAGQFSITINYNIPNALLFQRGLWVQFGNDSYMFGEILNITDSIGADGKGSQIRNITGYDARYIFKRRIIKNLNNVENWNMTAKGELVMRNLIKDQCGSGAEVKRQLPIINAIPSSSSAIGGEYSVAEAFTNLYEVLVTIATQSEIGWRIKFDGNLTLEFYEGEDRHLTVRFDTDYESLANGEFTDSAESFANAVFVGGKGTGSERDIYEGEMGSESPAGLDRYEAWDNQSSMTTEDEYEAEALSILSQYGQTLMVSGNGLAKCPYEYGKEYNVGDIITIAFSGKSAVVQILSVIEHWTWGGYDLEFSFGKPQPDLNKQLQLMLRKIQGASNKTNATESVKWYNVANVNSMSASDVTFNTIGFTGTMTANKTFTFYLDDEKTGAKSYNIYVKNLSGNYNLTLTTGRAGKTNYVLKGGVNLTGRILVDDEGNITSQSVTATSVIESGNNQPATSDGVANAIQGVTDIASSLPTDAVLHYSFDEVPDYPDGTAVYYRNKDFTTSDGWRGGSNVITAPNGILTIANVATSYVYKNFTGGSIVKSVITSSVNKTIKLYATIEGVTTTLLSQVVKANVPTEFIASIPSGTITAIGFDGLQTSSKFEITSFYLGDGSYSTPIIDNANGQWNSTSQSGVAVQGVSGKGLKSFIGNYTVIGNYHFGNDFSYSIWVNPQDVSSGKIGHIVAKPNTIVLRNGSSENNYLQIYGYFKEGGTFNTGASYGNILTEGWTHLCLVKNGTSLKFYKNGVLIDSRILNYAELQDNGDDLSIGGSTNTRTQTYDDLLIFDRALTETEVMALYLNKANTPKYYDINNYNLKQIKDITAQSTDFADFQSRMAGLATRSLHLIEPTTEEDER